MQRLIRRGRCSVQRAEAYESDDTELRIRLAHNSVADRLNFQRESNELTKWELSQAVEALG